MHDKEKIISTLKEKKYRITDIRKSIIDIIYGSEHVTLNYIIDSLRSIYPSNLNITSIYNTLDLLIKEHLLFTNIFDGKEVWYEPVSNPSIHMVCDLCKGIVHSVDPKKSKNFSLADLNNFMTEQNWKPLHFKIEAHGICHNCSQK